MASSLELANLKIRITTDASGAQEGFEDVAKSSEAAKAMVNMNALQMADALQDIGEKATQFVSKPIINAFKACIESAGDFTETLGKTDVVFGEMSESVKKWSESSVESMGVAQSTALEMVSLFGDMATGMGFSATEAANMSMKITQLAADLASFKNIGVDQAQSALKGIFTGETQALKSLGVVMNETTLAEYALAKGITTKYSAMSNSEKVMLRYQYVMESTANAQGDFARTGDSLANQQRKLSESIKDLGTSFGQILQPVVTKFISILNSVITWVRNTSTGFKTFITVLGATAAAVGPVLAAIAALQKIKTIALFAQFAAAGPVIAGVAAAIAGLTTIIMGVSKASEEAAEKQKELAKQYGRELANKYRDEFEKETTDTTTITVDEKVAEQSAAKARLDEIQQSAIDAGDAIRTINGAIALTDIEGLDGIGGALMYAATSGKDAKEKVDALKESITSLYDEQKAQIEQTYLALESAYIASAVMSGASMEEITAVVSQLNGEMKALTGEMEMSEEDLKKFTDIFADGIQENDIPALMELYKKYPELRDAIKLTDEQLMIMMTNAEKQPEAAATAMEMMIERIAAGDDKAAQSFEMLFTNYEKGIEKAQKAESQFSEAQVQNAESAEILYNAWTRYIDLLASGNTAEEARKQLSTEMYAEMGSEAQKYVDQVMGLNAELNNSESEHYQDTLGITKELYGNMTVAQEVAYDIQNKNLEDWSETTKLAYKEYMSSLGITLDENYQYQTKQAETLYEGLSRLRESHNDEEINAVKDYFTANGIEMDEGQLAILTSNEEFWDAYDKAAEDGVLSAEEIAQLGSIGLTSTAENAAQEVADSAKEMSDEIEAAKEEMATMEDVEITATAETEADTDSATTAGSTLNTTVNDQMTPATATVEADTATAQTEGKELGDEVINSAETTITKGRTKVGNATRKASKGVSLAKPNAKTEGKSVGSSAVDGINSGISSNKSKIATQAKEAVKKVKDATANAKSNGKEVGKAIDDGIVSGINANIYKIKKAAQEAAKAALKAAKAELDVNSPSKVFANQVGSPIDEGIAKGILDNISFVDNALGKVLDKVITSGSSTVNNALQNAQPTTVTNNNIGKQGGTTNINQTINFTSKEMSPYEQLVQAKKLNKQLASAFV